MTSEQDNNITAKEIIGIILIAPMFLVMISAIIFAVRLLIVGIWEEGPLTVIDFIALIMFGIGMYLLRPKS